jgi:dipeptidyl aminopeptidase/acylaminoacyl peptidase
VFENEGHSFRKKENRLAAYRSILGFLDTYLKADTTPSRRAGVDKSY